MPATISVTVPDPPEPPANYRASGFEVTRQRGSSIVSGPGPSGLSRAATELFRPDVASVLYATAEWSGTDEEFEAAKDNPFGWEIDSEFDPDRVTWGRWRTC